MYYTYGGAAPQFTIGPITVGSQQSIPVTPQTITPGGGGGTFTPIHTITPVSPGTVTPVSPGTVTPVSPGTLTPIHTFTPITGGTFTPLGGAAPQGTFPTLPTITQTLPTVMQTWTM